MNTFPSPWSSRSTAKNLFLQLCVCCGLTFFPAARLQAQQNAERVYRLAQQMAFPRVTEWKARKGPVAGGENPALDDTGWEKFSYQPVLGAEECWFRAAVIVPDEIALQKLAGRKLWLSLDVSGKGEVYAEGKRVAGLKSGQNRVVLAASARAGEKINLALHLSGEHQKVLFRDATLELAEWREAVELAAQLHMTVFTAGRLLGTDLRQRSQQLETNPGTDLSTVPAARRGELWQVLDRALGEVDESAIKKNNPEAFAASIRRSFAGMRELSEHFRTYTIYLISNAHIDLAWLWRWRETVEVAHDTFGSVLELMRKYPELTFTQSQAQLYEWIQDYYPEMFEEIKRRVAEGRWEVAGGMWVEPDCNLISGESWVRQILYAKRFFRTHFGVDVKIGWNPDSFGYNWNMPQFFSKSGITAFLTQKLLWNDTNIFPYHLFWWQGADGSRILVYMPYIGYTNVVNPYQMVDALRQFEANTGLRNMAFLIGYGDHGGGPDENMLLQARQLKEAPVFPRVVFGTFEDYLDSLPEAVKAKLPVYDNELYLEYHQGTYTTQAVMKKSNRELERTLETAEKLAALESLLGGGAYPGKSLEEAWKKVLFNQMHDILPGSGISAIYQDAGESFEAARKLAGKVIDMALEGLSSRIDNRGGGSGEPLVVFNSLSWPRGGVAFLPGDKAVLEGSRVYDEKGRRQLAQVVETAESGAGLIFSTGEIPATGYRVYRLRGERLDAPEMASGLKVSGSLLENDFLRVELDPASGLVTRVYDKTARREALAPGGKGNLIQLFEDKPKDWDAWNIGYTGVSWDLGKADKIEITEKGPLRATVRITRSFLGPTKPRRPLATSFPSSFFTQELSLYAGSPVIEVRNRFDWWEEQVLCKVGWELNVKTDTAYYEIPMAAIARPTTRNSDWEKARFEVPALRWADLSGADYGVSLLSESKYGYDALGNHLRLTLLKSPLWPDPGADRGTHRFRYGIFPHRGGWREGGTVRAAAEFCQPLLVHRSVPHKGTLPAEGLGFLSAGPENVVVSAFKAAEDGAGLVVRCYESQGRAVRAWLKLPPQAVEARESDLLENELAPAQLREGTLEFEIKPFEIKTFRITFSK